MGIAVTWLGGFYATINPLLVQLANLQCLWETEPNIPPTLLVASCDGNRDNLRLDGPLGSTIDFTHKQYQLKYCLLSQHTEYMLDVKIILTGEKPARYENSIIIMNHRCRLDWMFFWCVMARSGELALRNEKIMMKRELKYIPGPGE